MAKWVCQKAKIAGVITTADLQNCYYFKYAIIKFPTAKKKNWKRSSNHRRAFSFKVTLTKVSHKCPPLLSNHFPTLGKNSR